jgi:hypothetical protein
MIEQETLNELLKIIEEKGVTRVDSSLCVVNDIFFSKTDLLRKFRKKEDLSTTLNFFIGLYECRIKNIFYKINVFLVPRDNILVPTKQAFDSLETTMYKRLINFRGISLNNHFKKRIIPTPYNSFMDLIASEYFIVGAQKDQLIISKLKKKLRRHRLRTLKEKRVLKNINFPKTEVGDSVKTIFSVLFKETRQPRIRRKRINRAIRKKREKLKNQFKQSRLRKLQNEVLLDQKRELRLKLLKERKEALLYLERLKTYEKACKGSDLNPLDMLFKPFEK